MLSRAEERWVRGLSRRKQREREGVFLAEGVRVVEELLAGGIVPRLALISSSLEDTERGRALIERLGAVVPVREVGAGELNELADTEMSQGVLVVAETPDASLAGVSVEGASAVLVLDGIQDPGNVGTLVRTAGAFGVAAVACLPGTVDPWNPKVVRAAAGSLFRLPVVQPDVGTLVEWLDGHGFAMLGSDAGGTPIEDMEWSGRVALVVGNEGAGLTPPVAARCAGMVAVPMRRGVESLNVAVAAGILLYMITRERG